MNMPSDQTTRLFQDMGAPIASYWAGLDGETLRCARTARTSRLIWYSLALFGLGWGGLYTMIQLLAVNAFGLSSAGKILGTITLLDATTAGLGIWVTAKIFDVTKSYHIAFSLICVLIVLALLAATLVRDERSRATAA